MAKPKSRPQLSLDSARLWDDGGGIPPDHWSYRFYEAVFLAFDDGEFGDLYEAGGRYPVSPSLLAGITILQYLFRVSDRQAVEDTIMRRDWRIALGITPDYVRFCPTVLTRFRQRLVKHGRSRQLFETVLRRIRELGLLTGSRRVRVDATKLIADVARLSRADLIQEAIRVVVCALAKQAPELAEDLTFHRLYEAYGEEYWLGGGEGSDARLTTLGAAGYELLALCGAREVKGKAVLAQILEEQFLVTDDVLRPRTKEERPLETIASPHDPDALWGRERDDRWVGDKAHFVETADPDAPHLITDVLVTDSRTMEAEVLPELAERVTFATPEVDTLLADGGYAAAGNTERAAALGLDLVSPPRANTRRGKLPISAFALDFEREVARCPAGQESTYWHTRTRDVQIRWPTKVCAACPRRAECTDSPRGRTLAPSRHYVQLQRDRQRAETKGFRKLYTLRAPIEATISELVHCCGLRRSRYRGAPFRELHVLFAATALNVRRLLQWGAERTQPRMAAALARMRFGARLVCRHRGQPTAALVSLLRPNLAANAVLPTAT
jgi:transposase